MTFALSNTPNNKLHAHYATLCQLEQAAGERADALGDAESNLTWEKAWDQLTDYEDARLPLPVKSRDDFVEKVQIIRRLAKVDAVNNGGEFISFAYFDALMATFEDQTTAWARRRG
jgi:hypothetical protein